MSSTPSLPSASMRQESVPVHALAEHITSMNVHCLEDSLGTTDTPTVSNLSDGKTHPDKRTGLLSNDLVSPTSVGRFPVDGKDDPAYWNGGGRPQDEAHGAASRMHDDWMTKASAENKPSSTGGGGVAAQIAEQDLSGHLVHPLNEVANSSCSVSGVSSDSKRKKKKKSAGNNDFTSIMIAMRKRSFFRPYMFSKRHRRGKSLSSDASDSISSYVKPVPLTRNDRASSAPAKEMTPPVKRRFSFRRESQGSLQDNGIAPGKETIANGELQSPEPSVREEEGMFCSVEVQRRDSSFDDVVVDAKSDGGNGRQVATRVRSKTPPPPLQSINDATEESAATQDAALKARAHCRNRVSVLHGQSSHLQGLLYDITFDCGGDGRVQRRGPTKCASMANLFREEQGRETNSEQDFRGVTFKLTQRLSLMSLGSLTDSCVDRPLGDDERFGTFTPQIASCKKNVGDVDDGENDLYYDSDPGELKFLRRRHLELLGSNHARSASCEIGCKIVDSSLSGDEEDQVSEGGVHLLSMGSSFDDDDDCSYDAMVGLKDDDPAVEEARNRTMDVIWHPNISLSKDKFDGQTTPLRCTAWIADSQSGANESPKFKWKANDEPNRTRKRIAALNRAPYSVDLSDIARVSTADEVDRSLHPFAWGCKSFVIQTSNDDKFLFEAATERERDDDINALKLITARHESKKRSRPDLFLSDHRNLRMSSGTMWVSKIEDENCEDVYVPPLPSAVDQIKDEVELVITPGDPLSNKVMKVQQRTYYER